MAKKRAKAKKAKGGRRVSRGSRKNTKAGASIKKPLLLAHVEPKGHAMHRNSGQVLYWLVVLALVVLNMLSVLIIPVLQVSSGSQSVLVVVAVLGLFFGYVTHRLVNLVDNLEATHHFFARLLVPAAAILNLFIVSSATNKLSAALNLGFTHNPVYISLAYGVAFVLPSLYSAASAAYSMYARGGRKGAKR
ncbi:hypothetical protein HYU40_00740 [Candidatus Woesearchaeota archaeon]|nr:hypothetical protein [Candidatus Woesearchaeota archaeon]